MPIHYDAIEDGQTKHPTVYSLIIHSWPVTYVYLAGLCRWELGTDSNLVSSVSFSDGVDAEFTGQLWNTPWTPNSFTAAPAPHMHVVFDRPVTVSSVQTQGDVDGNMVSKFMISYLMSRDADFEDLSYEDGYPVSRFFFFFWSSSIYSSHIYNSFTYTYTNYNTIIRCYFIYIIQSVNPLRSIPQESCCHES